MSRLRAALVTPLTGTLGEFGRASAAGLGLWADHAAHLPAPFDGVALEVVDSGPDPASAMRAATADRPDVVFGPYGSSPALEAIRATSRVVWNHGGATSQLRRPEFPQVINVLSPASAYPAGLLRAVRAADPEAATVAALHRDSSGFGRDVISGAADSAAGLGFDLRTTQFESGHAAEAAATLPDADLLFVVGGFEEELEAARVLLRRSWPAASFVGAGVEEVLAPLGRGREGLLGPAQWLAAAAPEPDEGPDAGWFVERYRQKLGSDPPYPAVQAFAAGVLCARCLREAGDSDDAAQLAAARQLQCTTLYGRFRLDPQSGLQTGHEVLIVQWQDGARRVVWPRRQAERRLIYPLMG